MVNYNSNIIYLINKLNESKFSFKLSNCSSSSLTLCCRDIWSGRGTFNLRDLRRNGEYVLSTLQVRNGVSSEHESSGEEGDPLRSNIWRVGYGGMSSSSPYCQFVVSGHHVILEKHFLPLPFNHVFNYVHIDLVSCNL